VGGSGVAVRGSWWRRKRRGWRDIVREQRRQGWPSAGRSGAGGAHRRARGGSCGDRACACESGERERGRVGALTGSTKPTQSDRVGPGLVWAKPILSAHLTI
jgi:hypothetical protein